MGINGRFGIDEKKVKRLGKNYSSIDFDLKENLTAEAYVTKGDYTPVGEFTIANKYFPVTKIEQTAKEARSALVQAYRLGLMH